MIVQLSHYTSKDIISQCSIALKKTGVSLKCDNVLSVEMKKCPKPKLLYL